ncbi:hypothetical protein PISMIDRAFT_452918 [Pisolithus microcarpus 441]|uniref:Unplaced genomic scaffold scaffold_404, whole genome shotgun sequence n=1 Tax=Pisolithus microcarpus 441 TaxID=765257 RepID=A0A0C9YEN6_9AGAM|nr:hypothetical protein PISMIDRAFT_452918 [Pisolithus microcarpus 441]
MIASHRRSSRRFPRRATASSYHTSTFPALLAHTTAVQGNARLHSRAPSIQLHRHTPVRGFLTHGYPSWRVLSSAARSVYMCTEYQYSIWDTAVSKELDYQAANSV